MRRTPLEDHGSSRRPELDLGIGDVERRRSSNELLRREQGASTRFGRGLSVFSTERCSACRSAREGTRTTLSPDSRSG